MSLKVIAFKVSVKRNCQSFTLLDISLTVSSSLARRLRSFADMPKSFVVASSKETTFSRWLVWSCNSR